MTHFPDPAAWRAACADDAVLRAWAGPWQLEFAIEADNILPLPLRAWAAKRTKAGGRGSGAQSIGSFPTAAALFAFGDGRPTAPAGQPCFTLAAPARCGRSS